MNQDNKSTLRPVLGIFNLSSTERIVFSIITFFMGSLICSYKNQDVYYAINTNQSHGTISSWFTVPFILTSFWLVDEMIKPNWVSRLKSTSKTKYFLADILFGMVSLFILSIIYSLSSYMLYLSLWK